MKTLIVTFSIMLLFGCATLFNGSPQRVTYGSAPSGAQVFVNGSLMGTTPFELNMKKDRSYTLEFRKEGFQSKTVVINSNVGAGWIILDILGGLVPIVVDAATGAWHNLDQDNVNAALEAK